MSSQTISPVKTYVWIWAALIALLLLSCGSAYLGLGTWSVVVNVGIALMKMLLVMIFFMRLREAGGLIRIFAAAGFFFLALLIGLSLDDFLTRDIDAEQVSPPNSQ